MLETLSAPAARSNEAETRVRDIARTCLERGQLREARATLHGAVAAGLLTAGLLNDLGTVLTLLGQLGEAEQVLRLALRLAPRSRDARRNLADLLLLTHRHAEAVQWIRGVLPELPPEERERLAPHVRAHELGAPPAPMVQNVDEIWAELRALPGVEAKEWRIDAAAFRGFPCAHPWSSAGTYYEKKLQYYLSAALLRLQPGDRYVDIASQGSAFPGYVRRLVGCEVYRQDLHYEDGLDHCLAGNAAQMDVPDAFFSAMALHCSFEHFEGDADTAFIREAARVLRPGGRLCILPLYMALEPAENYQRGFLDAGQEKLLGEGCEFHRNYSPRSLRERVLAAAAGKWRVEIYRTVNLGEIRSLLPPHQVLNSNFVLFMTRL